MIDRPILTVDKFTEFTDMLSEKANGERSLETYLSALWKLLDANRNATPSWELFADLLERAFDEEPSPFNVEWLNYTSPPDIDVNVDQGFQLVQNMVLYQIADLHAMAEAGTLTIDPKFLYLGVDSPNGHRWFNLNIRLFLKCASPTYDSTDKNICNWKSLASFLWFGQNYE